MTSSRTARRTKSGLPTKSKAKFLTKGGERAYEAEGEMYATVCALFGAMMTEEEE